MPSSSFTVGNSDKSSASSTLKSYKWSLHCERWKESACPPSTLFRASCSKCVVPSLHGIACYNRGLTIGIGYGVWSNCGLVVVFEKQVLS